MSHILIILSLS